MTSRVAVLVDGDNIPANYSPDILSVAKGLGRVDIARVYADACKSPGWDSDGSFRLVHAGCGKNASDILLVIDAMELAFAHAIDAFVVATSDRDFTHLVQRLREMGRIAIGVGEVKTPPGFRANCTQFFTLRQPRKSPPTCRNSPSELDRKIRAMIASHSRNGQGMRMLSLASNMQAQLETEVSVHPGQTWRAYLDARPHLYELDPCGPAAMVRFLPQGFAARADV